MTTDTVQVLGIDIGKNWFHLVGLDERGRPALRKKLNRRKLLAFAGELPTCVGATVFARSAAVSLRRTGVSNRIASCRGTATWVFDSIAIHRVGTSTVYRGSPEFLRCEYAAERRASPHIDSRGAERHLRADHRIEHPARHGDDHPRRCLDVNKLPGGALLAVVSANSLPVKRMPAIVDGHALPDMGRMTRREPVSRRNWLFSDTVHGAKDSANLCSLIETARANSLEPHAYLRHVFAELPKAETVEQIEALLPYRLDKAVLNTHPA